jgi:alpha-tubulin suppressor-like RCC1 family protein
VAGLSNVVAVAAGTAHSLALTSSGTVFAWGSNTFGMIGDGTTTQRKTPVALALTDVVAIAAGGFHSLALRNNGDVYIWGRNSAGQIGNGTTTNAISPWLLTTGAQAIGAGAEHTLVVKTDGTVWATGSNAHGQLSDGSTTSRTTLGPASGLTSVVAASGGEDHSVFLLADGTVQAAGVNSSGELGDASTTQRTLAVPVSGLSGIVAIDAGAHHALAAAADGSLYSWGDNTQGGLGDGTATDRTAPVAVANVGEIAAFSAGQGFSLAFTPLHYVWVAGRNNSSQLGDGATTDVWAPVSISDADFAWRVATPTFSVAPGTYTSDRTVVIAVVTAGATIHYTQNGAEPTEADPVVASGGSVLVTQTQTLRARAWKTGLPTGNTGSAAYTMQVALPTVSPAGGTYTSARTVTMSTSTPGATVRYTLDGTDPTPASPAYASALTVGTTTTVKAVGFKPNWSDSHVRAVTYTMNFGTLTAPTIAPAGGTYTGAVTVTLTADAQASIHYTLDGATPSMTSPLYTGPFPVTNTGTLRARAFHPDYTASATTAQAFTLIAATPTFSLPSGEYAPGTAVTVSGDAGSTLRWTLDGTDPAASSPVLPATPILLGPYTIKVRAFRSTASDSAVASATYALTAPLGPGAVSVGDDHVLLATPEGLLYGWGWNNNAQVGDGSAATRSTPVLVPTLTGVVAVAAGDMHSLAVTADGAAWGWGYNYAGAVGDGTMVGTRSRPVPVTGVSNAVAVAAGSAHSLLLTASGEVYAFGQGSSGQLGQNSTASSGTPLLVPGLSTVVAIAAGANHSLAVTAAGEVWAWGANDASQLGDTTTTTRLVPTLVPGLTNVVAVAAGDRHSLARTRSGALWVWGEGANGRLGLGDQTTQPTPVLLPNVSGAVVDAGASHSALLGSDGTLRSWGLNTQGQVGIGSTGPVLSPTAAIGLPAGLTALSLGGGNSVAVAVDGGVWTWGAGGPPLGDGTSAMRSAPALAWTAPGRWSPPPPMLSVPTGTYSSEQVVLVTSAAPGATLRYTTNGQDPTETDPEVPATGDVLIAASMTLKARAWVPDRAPSAVAAASYTLQPALPTLTPATGSYTGPQTVTIGSSDPLAVLHYTLDGSTPTTASPLYGGAFPVATTTTVQARAFRAGWTPSATASSTITLTAGTLATPTVEPAAGVYMPAQSITLAGPAGATLRYTLDGTEPTATSPIYAGPLTLSEGTVTVKARAFQTDWTPSATRTASYTIDGTPPTMQTTSSQQPIAGWYRDPVTVSFTCDDAIGVASCPSPITVSAEGETVVSGTAADLAGNTTLGSMTVRLDLAPPVVTLTTPATDTTTTAVSLAVAGTVSDGGSGLAVVQCNEVAATVSAGVATCTVPLQPGRNSVVLVARDAAGHATSHSVRVTRTAPATSLTLTPESRTMLAEEAIVPSLLDQTGAVVSGATWSSSDAAVVSLSTDDPPVLSAEAAGTVTITATKDGLTATAAFTVLAATSMPVGTTRWSVPPSTGMEIHRIIYAHRVAETVPDLFAVTRTPYVEHPEYRVQATQADGTVVWTEVAPGRPLFGDHAGGLVAAVERTGHLQRGVIGLARFATPPGTQPWRYTSAGEIGAPFAFTDTVPIAQAPDGSIYFVEETGESPHVDSWLVKLNGNTGTTVARALLPKWRYTCNGALLASHSGYWPPIVDDAGQVQLLMSDGSYAVSGDCQYHYLQTWTEHHRMLVASITPNGELSTRMIRERTESGGGDDYGDTGLYPEQVLPDGLGGLLVQWDSYDSGAWSGWLSRVVGLNVSDFLLASSDDSISLVGDGGTAYLASATGASYAVDVTSLTTKWASPAIGVPTMSIAGGGLALHQAATGLLLILDQSGTVRSTSSLVAGSPNQETRAGEWVGITSSGHAASIAAPFLIGDGSERLMVQRSSFSFHQARGNRLGQSAPEPNFDTREQAAIAALAFVYEASRVNLYEFGGLICAQGQKFAWSRIVTDAVLDQVAVQQSLCPGAPSIAAHYHTHPPPEDYKPSGNDLDNADVPSWRGIPRYLMAPTEDRRSTHVFKWWNDESRPGRQNVCVESPTGWVPYQGIGGTENANCSTPVP